MANKIKKGDKPSTRTPRSFGWGPARWSIPDWPAAWLFPLASRISCTATAVSRIPRGLHGLQSQWRSEKKWPIRKKTSNKAKSLSWNGIWVKTVASGMGKNAHSIGTRKQICPLRLAMGTPCFNSGLEKIDNFDTGKNRTARRISEGMVWSPARYFSNRRWASFTVSGWPDLTSRSKTDSRNRDSKWPAREKSPPTTDAFSFLFRKSSNFALSNQKKKSRAILFQFNLPRQDQTKSRNFIFFENRKPKIKNIFFQIAFIFYENFFRFFFVQISRQFGLDSNWTIFSTSIFLSWRGKSKRPNAHPLAHCVKQ